MKPNVKGIYDRCGGWLYRRDYDKLDVVQKRLSACREQTQPLLDYNRERDVAEEISIKGISLAPAKVVDQILDVIGLRS